MDENKKDLADQSVEIVEEAGAEANEIVNKESSAIAREIEEASLTTNIDKDTVEKIKSQINLDRIEMYGSETQKATNTLSEEVLKNVKNKEIGVIGDTLKESALQIKNLDRGLKEEDKKGFFGFLREKKDEKVLEIQSVAKQLSDIEGTLEKNIEILYKDTDMFNKLYDLNEQKFQELEHLIKAGEEYKEETELTTLKELELSANVSGDPMAVQQVNDLKNKLNRLDKKLTDLKVTRHLAIQTAPQIRLIQGNNVLLVQNIQTTINTILPVVRSNVAVTAGLNRQKEILELNNAVSELANNVLLENSRLMKDNVVETVKQSEKPIIKIETLREVNQNILQTIDSAIKVQAEGIEKRKQVNEELIKLEGEFIGKLSEYQN
ncbi:MAG: toxic anion resistance protein [Tissierellia bacterium]|nr:toxic anion resistance protein [Tissierellia bacterium]